MLRMRIVPTALFVLCCAVCVAHARAVRLPLQHPRVAMEAATPGPQAGDASWPCQDASVAGLPFCDPSLSPEERARDLVSRLTLEEKIPELGSTAPGVPRLSVPPYIYWNEALHGVGKSPGVHFRGQTPFAVSFPQVVGLAAAFNMSMVHAVAQAIATEARAFYSAGNAGLTFWSPNINIVRDPRWGRAQETPGEDPLLTARYAETFVRGLQESEGTQVLKALACCKHYAAYDLENYQGMDRFHFDARVERADFFETYLPAFEACVRRARVGSIMCSYNSVNGVPACASAALLQDTLRDKWGFGGYVVSDCDAVENIHTTHNFTASAPAAAAAALAAGTDLDCSLGNWTHRADYFTRFLPSAVQQGLASEAAVDEALRRVLTFRFRLGMFDDPATLPFAAIGPQDANTPAHKALALQAARESLVLLKNERGTLPLDASRLKRVAVIGPHANATTALLGNYEGVPDHVVSPFEAIAARVPGAVYAQGCPVNCTATNGFAAAEAAAASADAVVMVLGIDQSVEAESLDRVSLELPGQQQRLAQSVLSVTREGVPVVAVLVNGGALSVDWLAGNVPALVEAWYGGQMGGQALADVLFGDYNPAGRLPVTIYPAAYAEQVDFLDMSMRTGPGRTYKYYTGTPLYAFGHGLSYTTFSHRLVNAPAVMTDAQDHVELHLEVANTGSMAGDEVVLAFVELPHGVRVSRGGEPLVFPPRRLFDFKRVHVPAGATVPVTLALSRESVHGMAPDGSGEFLEGEVTLRVGQTATKLSLVRGGSMAAAAADVAAVSM